MTDAWRAEDKTGDIVDSIHVCNLRMTNKGEANYGQPSHEGNVQYGVESIILHDAFIPPLCPLPIDQTWNLSSPEPSSLLPP